MENFNLENEVIRIESLNINNYNTSYLNLLKQLSNSNIDYNSEKSNLFLENLNDKHIIKILINETNIIIGSITILKERKIIHNYNIAAHIEDVVIHEDYRGKGLAKKLINIAKYECSECYKIILNCTEEMVYFYEKNGFQKKNVQMAIYKN